MSASGNAGKREKLQRTENASFLGLITIFFPATTTG